MCYTGAISFEYFLIVVHRESTSSDLELMYIFCFRFWPSRICHPQHHGAVTSSEEEQYMMGA